MDTAVGSSSSRVVMSSSSYSTAHHILCEELRRRAVVELHSESGSVPVDSVRFYREFVAQSVPVVIRGLAANWPAVRRWRSSANMSAALGCDALVTIASTPNGRADAVTEIPRRALVVDPGAHHSDDATAVAHHDSDDATVVAHHNSDDASAAHRNSDRLVLFVSPLQTVMPFVSFMQLLLSQSRRLGPPLDVGSALCPPEHTFRSDEGGLFDKAVVYAQLQNNSLHSEYAKLLPNIHSNVADFGEALFGRAPEASNVWIGSAHSVTTTHQDWYENLYTVVCGTKTFHLIPPWESPFVGKAKYLSGEYCAVDHRHCIVTDHKEHFAGTNRFGVAVDWAEHGRTPWVRADPSLAAHHPVNREAVTSSLAHASTLTVEVGPGDVLYLPAAWFHHVSQRNDAEGKVVAVNYWYDMQFGPVAALQAFVERCVGGDEV